jgi:RNA polymerase sigma factor (TIGR02999 family)
MSDDVTHLLRAWRAGDGAAFDRLMPLVYDELRSIARSHLRRERSGHTLQPTALAHEAYLKLLRHPGIDWQSRAHFLAMAALEMRRILVGHARRRRAAKRGGADALLPLGDDLAHATATLDLVDLDDALQALAVLDPRQGRVVELRFFGGLTVEETAEVLDVSPATVKLDWSLARAFLRRELGA